MDRTSRAVDSASARSARYSTCTDPRKFSCMCSTSRRRTCFRAQHAVSTARIEHGPASVVGDDKTTLVDGTMNANSATKPGMMPTKNLAKNCPVGVLKPRCTTTHDHTRNSDGGRLPSSPSPSIRAGIWRCATPRAPRQLPSLTPPDREIQTPEVNSRVDKTWGQGQLHS